MEQVDRPSRTAFEKSERELRKPHRHAAKDQGSAELPLLKGVPADVVEHVVRRRPPAERQVTQSHSAMRRDRKLELSEFAPHRVIVIKAVDAIAVEVGSVRKSRGRCMLQRRNRPCHSRRYHHRSKPETCCIFKLCDCFLGCVHRNHGGRRDPIAIGSANFRIHRVDRAAGGAAHGGVENGGERQSESRIHDGKIDPNLLEALMQKPRRHDGGKIVGVVTDPPPRSAHFPLGPIRARCRGMLAQFAMVTLHQLVAADLAQVVVEQRRRFDQVAVAVDYRMVELCAERSDTADLFRIHGRTLWRDDAVRLARPSKRSQGWSAPAEASFTARRPYRDRSEPLTWRAATWLHDGMTRRSRIIRVAPLFTTRPCFFPNLKIWLCAGGGGINRSALRRGAGSSTCDESSSSGPDARGSLFRWPSRSAACSRDGRLPHPCS